MAVVDGNADARGELRIFRVAGHDGADTVGNALGFIPQGFRQDESEFVTSITSGSVDRAAVDAQDMRKSIQRVTTDKVAVRVVDFLQPIKIKQQDGKGPSIAIRAFGFRFQDVEQAAIVSCAPRFIHAAM